MNKNRDMIICDIVQKMKEEIEKVQKSIDEDIIEILSTFFNYEVNENNLIEFIMLKRVEGYDIEKIESFSDITLKIYKDDELLLEEVIAEYTYSYVYM
jgi:hypothetical protein